MMRGAAGRVSLFITLGIAAVDMLTCAFVSAVVLFILFLVPKEAAGASDSQDLLLLHWSALAANGAVVGIELERNRQRSTIWSDDPQSAVNTCSALSKTPDLKDACYLANSENDAFDQDGVLIITRPMAGQWSINMTYSDTSDNGNGGNYAPIDLRVTVVRNDAVELSTKVAAGEEINIAKVDRSKTGAVNQLLLIE